MFDWGTADSFTHSGGRVLHLPIRTSPQLWHRLFALKAEDNTGICEEGHVAYQSEPLFVPRASLQMMSKRTKREDFEENAREAKIRWDGLQTRPLEWRAIPAYPVGSVRQGRQVGRKYQRS